MGLGKSAKATTAPEWGTSAFQQAGAAAAAAAKTSRAVSVAVALVSAPSTLGDDAAKAAALGQMATGESYAQRVHGVMQPHAALSCNYEYDRYLYIALH